MNMGKTFLLELNSVNMSYCSTKEAIINKLSKYFFFLFKDLQYNIRTIGGYLSREKTLNSFWPLGISSHSEEKVWFVKMPANGHSILEQLSYKPRTSHIRRKKNKFVFQRPNIFSIISIIYSSIL